MTSTLPSGPKPTKETYLAALRILKEHHQNAEEEHQLVRNSPNKAMAGKSVLCGEEIVLAKPPGENTATSLLKTAKTVAPKEPTKSTKMPTKEPEAQMSAKVVKPSQASSKSVKMNPITQSSKRAHHISSEALKAEPKETIKLGSKATRRFTVVAGLLPNFRLDKSTKIKVAETLKELNCWSDDELAVEEEEEDNDSDSTDSEFEAKRAVPPPVPETTPAAVPLTAHNKSMKKTAPAGLIKSTVVSKTAGNNSSNKAHAYLQEQKEQAKRKAKEAMVKKAIKLFVRVRKEEMDAHCKQQWATNGKHAVERAMIARVAAARWDRILRQAMPVAVDRRVKLDRRKRRQERRRHAAQCVVRKAWRKFRVRLLLGCVVEFIRLKARLFREQQVREEREFRMRTARRRVKEDCQFKEWVAEQREFPTFPMKPDSVAVISPRLLNVLQQQPQQQAHSSSVSGNTTAEVKKENFKVLFDNSILAAPKASLHSPRPPSKPPATAGKKPYVHPPHSGFFLTEMASSGAANNGNIFPSSSSSSVSPRAVLSASSLALSFSQASPRSPRPLHQQSQQPSMAMQQQQFADAAYTRPDLAPFSSMINQMITSSTLFQSKQEPHWTDIASVSADYASQFKEKKKSPAYRALEQLSGVTEADVVRSQLLSHKDSVHLKLKSFGHSIVSL